LTKLDEHVRRGEFVQAIQEAQRLLTLPDLTSGQRGSICRLLGRAKGESGDPFGGLKVLELSIPLAMKAKDWDCLGKARAELGISWLTIGDYSQAVECFQAYLLDLHRYDSAKSYLGPVHYNLGLAYRRRKDHLRALYHYHQAVEWFTERGYTLHAGKTHQNLAWLYCLEDDAQNAEIEVQVAESFAEVCGTEFKTEQLLCRSFIHILRKEVVPAVTLACEVLQPGRPGTTDTHRANANWLAGRCSLALYNFDSANAFAAFATEYALRANDTAAMSLASNLKAEVARRRKGFDEAAM
jgi:tetratricopeptide (TPR) repeat protein